MSSAFEVGTDTGGNLTYAFRRFQRVLALAAAPARGYYVPEDRGAEMSSRPAVRSTVRLFVFAMIPVLLITGFLGSGKTTLLNRVMARRAARGDRGRIALVVNELGEVGIDGALLAADATRQVELPGGCICCQLNDELDRTLLDLIERHPRLDAIVIETTGIAEPMPIAWTMERASLASLIRLAAVVTLVDASRFPESRPLNPAVDDQVEYADVVVITKADLVVPVRLAEVRALVAQLAPRAPVVEGTPDHVAAWLDGVLQDPPLDRAPRAAHDHDHGTPPHVIDSVWVPIEGLLDLEELIDALEELPPAYIRVKGIAQVVDGRTGSGEPHYAAFHRVGLRVSTETLPVSKPENGAQSTVEREAHGMVESVAARGEAVRPMAAIPTRAVALGPGVTAGPLAACIGRAVLSSRSKGRGAERWP